MSCVLMQTHECDAVVRWIPPWIVELIDLVCGNPDRPTDWTNERISGMRWPVDYTLPFPVTNLVIDCVTCRNNRQQWSPLTHWNCTRGRGRRWSLAGFRRPKDTNNWATMLDVINPSISLQDRGVFVTCFGKNVLGIAIVTEMINSASADSESAIW